MGLFAFPILSKLVPLLLANGNIKDITDASKTLYRDLNHVGTFHHKCSPTIHFSFVPPPLLNNNNNNTSWSSAPSNTNYPSYPQQSNTATSTVFDSVHTHFPSHSGKALAILLPGLDGVGISSTSQFDDLSDTFEFWRLVMDVNDRTSFGGLVQHVEDFLSLQHDNDDDNNNNSSDREIVLIGESFGGLLAPNVALRIMKRYSNVKMVLVNPATSYEESQWSTLAPLLYSLRHYDSTSSDTDDNNNTANNTNNNLPSLYSIVGGMALAATVPDGTQFQQILNLITNTSPSMSLQDTLSTMRDGFGILADNLPAATLEHRISRWMPVGVQVLGQSQLSTMDIPTLIVGGEKDNMLPTKREAQRLVKLMPNAQSIDIPDAGHFVLDQRVNLTELILSSTTLYPETITTTTIMDPVLDWKAPNATVFQEALESRIQPMRRLTSPVFFSTDKNGRRKRGVSHVPGSNDGPLLFVANHQLFGQDLGLIISHLVEERDLWVRGLAHPILFQASSQMGGDDDTSSTASTFQTFGAVQVTPRNFYRLLQSQQAVLLFPGGVREVFHGKDEEYQLFWPDKTDFCRMAARFNATIVPLSALGAAESATILMDAKDMVKLPIVGDTIAQQSKNTMAARYDRDNEDELFTPPFAVPKPLPDRHYFVFGRPMDTTLVDPKNKEQCEALYEEVKTEMRRGFDDVIRAREKDPYRDTATRLAREQVTGRPAPTFGIDELL